MTKRQIFMVLTSVVTFVSFGQTSDSLANKIADSYLFSKKNSLNLEAFGHGAFYSINYERILIDNYHYKLGGQIGTAIYPSSYENSIWIPISINYIKTFGLSRRNHAEYGVGHVLRYARPYFTNLYNGWVTTFLSAKAGYRHQKPNSPWIFKLLLTPLLQYRNNGTSGLELYPYLTGAASIGRTF